MGRTLGHLDEAPIVEKATSAFLLLAQIVIIFVHRFMLSSRGRFLRRRYFVRTMRLVPCLLVVAPGVRIDTQGLFYMVSIDLFNYAQHRQYET